MAKASDYSKHLKETLLRLWWWTCPNRKMKDLCKRHIPLHMLDTNARRIVSLWSMASAETVKTNKNSKLFLQLSAMDIESLNDLIRSYKWFKCCKQWNIMASQWATRVHDSHLVHHSVSESRVNVAEALKPLRSRKKL